MKYSDYFMQQLLESGYTTCFYVGGGNSMHLLESASKYFECIPVVHEVSAAIASEYFNQSANGTERAFALVTAGPGLTNLVTGVAGAWLDSRELLVIGGQAKSTNLAKGKVRQIGHQEVDGVGIVGPITKQAITIERPISGREVREIVSESWKDRPGPVFIEVCLDVSATIIEPIELDRASEFLDTSNVIAQDTNWTLQVELLVKAAERPLILFGGGRFENCCSKIYVKHWQLWFSNCLHLDGCRKLRI